MFQKEEEEREGEEAKERRRRGRRKRERGRRKPTKLGFQILSLKKEFNKINTQAKYFIKNNRLLSHLRSQENWK